MGFCDIGTFWMVCHFCAFIITGDMIDFIQYETISWVYLINLNKILNISGIFQSKTYQTTFCKDQDLGYFVIIFSCKNMAKIRLPITNSPKADIETFQLIYIVLGYLEYHCSS